MQSPNMYNEMNRDSPKHMQCFSFSHDDDVLSQVGPAYDECISPGLSPRVGRQPGVVRYLNASICLQMLAGLPGGVRLKGKPVESYRGPEKPGSRKP